MLGPKFRILQICTSDGVDIKGQSQLQQPAKIHFQQLFHEDGISDDIVNAEILSNIPSLVSPEVYAGLVKPFTEKKLWMLYGL